MKKALAREKTSMRLMTSTIGEGREDAEGMLSTARSSASSATQTGEGEV